VRALLWRVVQAGVVAVLVTTLAFVLIQLAPGDPFTLMIESPRADPAVADSLKARFGLDRPIPEQYVRYVANVARGDLGYSFARARPVADVLVDALPNTLLLMGTALGVSFVLGVALGVAQAAWRGSRFDRATRGVLLAFYSLPDFWLAAMLLFVFAVELRWFPVGGAVDVMLAGRGGWAELADRLHRLVLPALTLTLLVTAAIARLQRAALLDTLPEDYVRTAAAKGLGRRAVLLRHALRNALLPVITLVGLALPALLGGAVFVERVFAYPGMGMLVVSAVGERDYFLLTACVFVGSLLVVLGSLLADLLAMLADPRQRGTAP
jgi:peptide/nickel transport system permease protein